MNATNCDHLENGFCFDCVERMKSDAAYARDEQRYEEVVRAIRVVRDGYNGRSARAIVMCCIAAAASGFVVNLDPSPRQETTE